MPKQNFSVHTKNSCKKAFTLVELLIVIVIIGILAGLVLAIINPARMRHKANVSVARANLDKICLALNACHSAAKAYTDCDTMAEIGITSTQMLGAPATNDIADNVPPYFHYFVAHYTSGAATGFTYAQSREWDPVGGTYTGGCTMFCRANFDTGESSKIHTWTVAECENLVEYAPW